jgi:hypothetical protein
MVIDGTAWIARDKLKGEGVLKGQTRDGNIHTLEKIDPVIQNTEEKDRIVSNVGEMDNDVL